MRPASSALSPGFEIQRQGPPDSPSCDAQEHNGQSENADAPDWREAARMSRAKRPEGDRVPRRQHADHESRESEHPNKGTVRGSPSSWSTTQRGRAPGLRPDRRDTRGPPWSLTQYPRSRPEALGLTCIGSTAHVYSARAPRAQVAHQRSGSTPDYALAVSSVYDRRGRPTSQTRMSL